MHLDSDVEQLAKGVTKGCVIFGICELVVFALLGAAGAVRFSPLMIVAIAGGTAVVAGCFWWMAASLQKSLNAAEQEGKQVKKGVMAGYNKRLAVQGLWILIAVFAPRAIYGGFRAGITVCGMIPLLFPRLAIYGLQITARRKASAGGKGGET